MNSNSVTKNFLYNATYQLLLIILPLITTPYISRVLGSGGMGTYTYTYTIANYFMLAAMLGVKNYGNRSTAAVRDSRQLLSRTFWEIYGLQFLCSAVVLAFYLIYILAFVRENRLIALIQGIYVLSGLLDISWLFFGVEQFRITVTRNIVIRLINLACIFLLVKDRGDLWIYTLIMTLGIALSQGYLWLYIRRIVDWYRPKLRDLRRHVLPELILFVPIIAVSLYTMMDKVMLGAMSTMNQVGFYEGHCTGYGDAAADVESCSEKKGQGERKVYLQFDDICHVSCFGHDVRDRRNRGRFCASVSGGRIQFLCEPDPCHGPDSAVYCMGECDPNAISDPQS